MRPNRAANVATTPKRMGAVVLEHHGDGPQTSTVSPLFGWNEQRHISKSTAGQINSVPSSRELPRTHRRSCLTSSHRPWTSSKKCPNTMGGCAQRAPDGEPRNHQARVAGSRSLRALYGFTKPHERPTPAGSYDVHTTHPGVSQPACLAFSSATTSATWSLTRTFGHTLAMRPSGSMRNVVRLMPMYSRPMNFFNPYTP